jgi:hypothetical protein
MVWVKKVENLKGGLDTHGNGKGMGKTWSIQQKHPCVPALTRNTLLYSPAHEEPSFSQLELFAIFSSDLPISGETQLRNHLLQEAFPNLYPWTF